MRTSPVSILLIEDDPICTHRIHTMMSGIMEKGSTLVCGKTLEEGLSLLAGGEYDVVLLSLSLPDGAGTAAVRTVREADPDVSVVALSPPENENVALAAVVVGAYDYLLKNEIDPGALECSISSALKRKSIEQKLSQSENALRTQFPDLPLPATTCNNEGEGLPPADYNPAAREGTDEDIWSYRHLLDNVQDMIFILDMDGTIRYVNRAVTRQLGYAEDEIIHTNISELITPETLTETKSIRGSVSHMSTGGVIQGPLEIHIIDTSGTLQILEIQAKSSISEDGKVSILGVARVITQRKQAEEALKASELRLRKMTEIVPDIFWRFTDLEGNITHITSSFERITGICAQVHIQQPGLWHHLIHPEDKKWFEASLSDPPGSRREREYRIMRPDGEIRWVSEKSFPINDDDGAMVESVDVVTDITEQTRARITRETLITELEKVLKKVNTLSGLIPICSSCKKIRDDAGYWNKLEEYIMEHSDAHFTHGICPDCSAVLYPNIQPTKSRKV